MIVLIRFTYKSYLVDIPHLEGGKKEINKLVNKFDKWLYDKDNNHGLWIIKDKKKYGVGFDVDDFVDWINRIFCSDETKKAKVLIREYEGDEYQYPIIYF